MGNKRKSIFDRMIFPAIAISAILFVLQLWEVIDVPVWVIAMPLIAVSAVIGAIMLFAFLVYLFQRGKE